MLLLLLSQLRQRIINISTGNSISVPLLDQALQHPRVVITCLAPAAAATRITEPRLSGVRMLSQMRVRGRHDLATAFLSTSSLLKAAMIPANTNITTLETPLPPAWTRAEVCPHLDVVVGDVIEFTRGVLVQSKLPEQFLSTEDDQRRCETMIQSISDHPDTLQHQRVTPTPVSFTTHDSTNYLQCTGLFIPLIYLLILGNIIFLISIHFIELFLTHLAAENW